MEADAGAGDGAGAYADVYAVGIAQRDSLTASMFMRAPPRQYISYCRCVSTFAYRDCASPATCVCTAANDDDDDEADGIDGRENIGNTIEQPALEVMYTPP